MADEMGENLWSHWELRICHLKISQGGTNTAPKFNIALKKLPKPKRKGLSSFYHFFRGYLELRECMESNNRTKSMNVNDCHILLHVPSSKLSGIFVRKGEKWSFQIGTKWYWTPIFWVPLESQVTAHFWVGKIQFFFFRKTIHTKIGHPNTTNHPKTREKGWNFDLPFR